MCDEDKTIENLTISEVAIELKKMSTQDLTTLYNGYKKTPMFILSASTGLYNIIKLIKFELEGRV